jgi:hypothetical protein
MFNRSLILVTLICSFIADSSCIQYKGEEIPLKVVLRHLANCFKGYNFDKIVEAGASEPCVIFDTDGTIISITDGLPIPIYLSSIPKSIRHLRRLRNDAQVKSDAVIGLYTLNTREEQDQYNLPETITDDSFVIPHHYPTIDFTAPSVDDLIRGVYDLSTRDTRNEEITCIHCRAGIGRSVTLTAAYLLYIYSIASKQYQDGSPVSGTFDDAAVVAMIVEYIKTKRSVAHPNREQRAATQQFYTSLCAAHSLEDLYHQLASDNVITTAIYGEKQL